MMLMVILISSPLLAFGTRSGMRGPHHPRGHYHYTPTNVNGPSITHDNHLTRDIEHIKEDLEEWGMAKEQAQNLTPEEMDFHYFKLHDYDKNTKLDGLEILQAIQHTLHKGSEETDGTGHEGSGGHAHHEEISEQDNFPFFVELIDQVLAEDDKDNDGYLSYIEYVVGRQKEQAKQRKRQHSHE